MKRIDTLGQLRSGQIMRLYPANCAPLSCLVYLPADFDHATPLLVAVHGIRREAQTLVTGLTDIAEQTSHAVIAPIFDAEHFPAYQRMIDSPDQVRPDWLLNRLIGDWIRHFGCTDPHISLFGFSGGAQFCHRYAYLNAGRVRRAILASAGWYTLPDETIRYPYGLKQFPRCLGAFNLQKFVAIDFLTLVGSEDLSRDASVRTGPRVDALQGMTRLQRAKTWCEFLNRARARFGSDMRITEPLLIHGMDHDLSRFIQNTTVKEVLLRSLSQEGFRDEDKRVDTLL